MTIKPHKDQFVLGIVMWFLTLSPYLILFLVFHDTPPQPSQYTGLILLTVPAHIFLICLAFRNWIEVSRIIEMDEKGCTVKRIGIKKRYSWDELQTKCVEYHEFRLLSGFPAYHKVVIFSKRKNFHTPEDFHINLYSSFCLNPFKFFYVGFLPEPNPRKNEVNENLFMEKMNEWGIELQEYKNGNFRPYKHNAVKMHDTEDKENNS